MIATGKEAEAARATVQRLVDAHGNDGPDSVMHWSSQRPHHSYPNGPTLIDVLEKRNQRYSAALDIGTARGMSALILAHWADHVYTIDIYKSEWVPRIWEEAGVADRITSFVVINDPPGKKKAKVIAKITFDMAFIDGNHCRGGVLLDYKLAKRCGLLLFHDYPKAYHGADGAGWVLGNQAEGVVTDMRPFAWWEAK